MSILNQQSESVMDAMEVDEEGGNDTKPFEEVSGSHDSMNNDNVKNVDIKALTERLKQVSPHLPISKLKRIARSDPEYILTAGSAFVATAFATELFVQSITEEMLALSHLSSKNVGSKNIRLTYDNMSECVARKETYNFLEDVVPKTKNLRMLVKQNRVRYSAAVAQNGQSTLPFTLQDSSCGVSDEHELDVANDTTKLNQTIEDDTNKDQNDDDDDAEDDEEEEEDEEEEDEEDEEEEEDEDDEHIRQQMREIEALDRVADLDNDQDTNKNEADSSENED